MVITHLPKITKPLGQAQQGPGQCCYSPGRHGSDVSQPTGLMVHNNPSWRLLSLNVNGLRKITKRVLLVSFLGGDGQDVIFMQETHYGSDG